MVKVNKTLKETVVGFVPHNKTFKSDLEHVLSVISLSKNQPFHSIFIAVQWNPTSGREENSFGHLWNQKVTNVSVPGARFSPVSLAQGMIGEGLIWKGLVSLVVECGLMALIFNLVGKLLDRDFVSAVTALALIGNGTIFESGVVQESAKMSAALKNLLFLVFLKSLFKKKPN